MFKQTIRRAILPIILTCFCWTVSGGEPASDSALPLAGHVKYCVAPDQYDFSQEYFLPVKFRPIAAAVPGLDKCEMSLDGKWRINPAPPEGFEEKTEEGEGWLDLNVPGQWVQQGFDIPQDKTAGISKTFDVPDSWAGRRIILRFDAIHGGTTYWLNGKKLGYSENLFTPVEFDITDFVIPGKPNRLVMSMKVMTISEIASFSSRYAMHSLGGIDRSVHLFALPTANISRLHYTTPLDEEYKNATLSLDVSIDNPTDKPISGLSLVMMLTGPDGKSVKLEQSKFDLPAVEPGESRFSPNLPVINPTKWNSEKPALYKLTVELQRDGKASERVEQAVGFRQVEIKGKQLYINGSMVKLKGVLRHEVNPLSGRADTARFGEIDVKLYRDTNFNYVRTIHYPATHEFYDACDRLGLNIECEAPFCWSPNRDDPNSTKQFIAAQAATIEFNRSHPSIITWSLGNETPWGCNFAENLKLALREDTSRLVVFNNGWVEGCHMAAWHYPGFPFDLSGQPQAIIFDEYLPPMALWYPEEYEYNPGQDVTWSDGQNSPDSYISQVQNSPDVVGGAICAGGDEEFYFADKSIQGYGCWGFFDVWRRKKSIWWDAKLMHSPAWIPVRRMVMEPGEKVVTIPVENRYSFTDLSEVKCTWELGDRTGSIALSLPPQAKGEIKVPVGENVKSGSMLVLRFTDANGELIAAHGVKLVDPSVEYQACFIISENSAPAKCSIKMDGDFSDWKDIKSISVGQFAEGQGDNQSGNDIKSVRQAADDENLYIMVECFGPITKKGDWSPTLILIDSDCNAATGFTSRPLGVDYFIQPFSETRTDLMIHRRAKEANSSVWNAWHAAVVVNDAYVVGKGDGGNCVEIRIPWKELGVEKPAGAKFRFRVTDGGVLLDPGQGDWSPNTLAAFQLPQPDAGCPELKDDGKVISIRGEGFSMDIERETGKILPGENSPPLLQWPALFFARAYDMFSRGYPNGHHFEILPGRSTRKINSITAKQQGEAVAVRVEDEYKGFKGFSEMLIDKTGRAVISFEYVCTDGQFTVDEAGLQFLFDGKCQEIRWLRDAEWDVYPDGNIGRAEGLAQAHMDKKWGKVEFPPYLSKPAWPWEQDENQYGTRDFRCTKYHIYNASLLAPDKSGIAVVSNGTTTDVRSCLSPDGVEFHIMCGDKPSCPLNGGLCQRYFKTITPGYQLKGSFAIKLLAPHK